MVSSWTTGGHILAHSVLQAAADLHDELRRGHLSQALPPPPPPPPPPPSPPPSLPLAEEFHSLLANASCHRAGGSPGRVSRESREGQTRRPEGFGPKP